MDKIMAQWSEALPQFPSADMEEISAAICGGLGEVCCCFWLFRYLHSYENRRALLLGDYCFGRFSEHLAAMDSVYYNNAFAFFLKEDTLRAAGVRELIDYILDAVEKCTDEH